MRLLLIVLALAWCTHAATVQGVIFDEETQNLMARTHVSLVPLPGTSGTNATQLTNDHGQYVFTNVKAGWYLVRASRIGYEKTESGQIRPGLPGTPFEITDQSADNDYHQIVMRRQAAITGSVVDDNAIGIPDWSISVYTARPPIRRVAEGLTNDRGDFRIGELEPGAYVVRSGGGALEDETTIVPSYSRYGTTVSNAEPVRLRAGDTQGFVVVHTVEGKLFEVDGEVTAPDKRPVRVSLITDTGRRMVSSTAGPFVATNVPPGLVGLLAEGAGCSGYQTINVDRNMFGRVDCLPVAAPVVSGALSFPVLARRVDLDGPGHEFPLDSGQSLSPGDWEFTVRTDATHYVVSIQNDTDTAPPPELDGWFELKIGNAPHIQVTLSAKPASISGVVSSPTKSVVGAPVFLELVNPNAPELALQSWEVRADPLGKFIFNGLAPGTYRVVSSFEVEHDEPLARDKSATVTLREADAVVQPLDLVLQ